MLNLNKNKLIPATEIIAYWGEIKGDISKQTDLVELTTDLDTSIKGWVESKGYLTEHQDLSGYALKTEIPSLDGYATENWVESKGYVTAETLPEGIATESWVQSQGYISDPNNDLAPLFNKNLSGKVTSGYLKYKPEEKYDTNFIEMSNQIISVSSDLQYSGSFCNTIGDKVYMYNPYENRFFIFDQNTVSFIDYQITFSGSAPTQSYPMWSDSQGRVYYGNKYILNIDDVSKTVEVIEKDLGGDFWQHSGTVKSNIIKKDGVIYMISYDNACAYIFNEETQSFDSSIPVQGTFPINTFYRYFSEFEGHWIYDVGKEQTELVFHLDEVEPYVEWVVLSERLFPGSWSYEYEGQTINETTRGVYVHPVVKDGVTEYYHFGYKNPVMYKLVNGAWEIVPYLHNLENMTTHIGGCACGTLWFGYGYQRGHTGEIIIWNMGEEFNYIWVIPEFYGWYDLEKDVYTFINNETNNLHSLYSELNTEVKDLNIAVGFTEENIGLLADRVSSLETNYGDALNITNQILG